MPRPLHYGRPGTRILPGTWQTQLAAVATREIADSGCVIQIAPPATSGWSEDAGRTVTTPGTPVYGPGIDPHDGIATITVASVFGAEHTDVIVDDPQPSRLYELRLPWDAPAAIVPEMVATVITDPDEQLVGAVLRIEGLLRGTRRFSRLLHATLIN